MSDITLSSGIRQNLLSLQQTSANLTTTQEQLATGKKVNSAADNPSSYFTSQNLTNSANSLSALLDQIGQGQQTINAATDGLTGISSLLQQALATVQQAQQASPTTAAAVTGTVALTTVNAGGNLVLNVGASSYTVSITASESISAIEAQINGTTGLGSTGALTATDDGSGHLVLTANSPSSQRHCRFRCGSNSARSQQHSGLWTKRHTRLRCRPTTMDCSPRSISSPATPLTTASICSTATI